MPLEYDSEADNVSVFLITRYLANEAWYWISRVPSLQSGVPLLVSQIDRINKTSPSQDIDETAKVKQRDSEMYSVSQDTF